MEHPPPVIVPHKNITHAEYLNEKQGQRKRQYEITNTNVAAPCDHDVVNKLENHYNLSRKSSPNERCQVYVHHFSKLPSRSSNNMQSNWRCGSEIHQTLYKHEFSDFYGAKIQCIRKQFDDLSLNSKTMRATVSPNMITKHNFHHEKLKHLNPERNNRSNRLIKMPQINSSPTARINKAFLFKPEHKAVVDKLEESYWTKWKPSKASAAKVPQHKSKGLYTENEKNSVPYQVGTRSEKKERGDSNEAIAACLSPTKHQMVNNNAVCVDQLSPRPDLCNFCASTEIEESSERYDDNTTEVEEEQISLTKIDITKESKSINDLTISNTLSVVISKSDSECKINVLKHTDSFILTSKKQTEEKPRYQQPKCIKLFKNLDYSTTAATNYVKGGTYPLKSCLKRTSNAVKPSSPLGPPGGSQIMTSNNRKPGKANRFST